MFRTACKAAPQNKKADVIQAIIDFANAALMPNTNRSPADEQQLVSLDAAESQGRAQLKLGRKLHRTWIKMAKKREKYVQRKATSCKISSVLYAVIDESNIREDDEDTDPWTIRYILGEASVRLKMDLSRGQPLCFVHRLLRKHINPKNVFVFVFASPKPCENLQIILSSLRPLLAFRCLGNSVFNWNLLVYGAWYFTPNKKYPW